nr:MAG TPA: hypothetical protein [Caudoviricetes sp.]
MLLKKRILLSEYLHFKILSHCISFVRINSHYFSMTSL